MVSVAASKRPWRSCPFQEIDGSSESKEFSGALLRVGRRLGVRHDDGFAGAVVLESGGDLIDSGAIDRALVLPLGLDNPELTVEGS